MASGSLRLLVVGNTSSGKTTTINSILGKGNILSEDYFSRDTSGYQSAERSGTVVEIIELPSLGGTKISEEDIAENVIQAVAGMYPGPTAILYVIGMRRYTEEDDSLYNRVKRLFDDRITEYTIIIFTGGDLLKQGNKKIEDLFKMSPESLRKVLQECGHRYVVFDNMADDKQPQVDRLLQEVCKLSEAHGGQPYKCPKYSYIGEKIEKELERKLLIVKAEFMRKTYVKEVEEKARVTMEKVEKEKRDFKKKEYNIEAERMYNVHELQEIINKEEYMATLLQEKEKEIRNKMKQERDEFRRYVETYKQIEVEEAGKEIQGTEIPLEEKKGSKEDLKDQKKIEANPSFSFSVKLEEIDNWAQSADLTPDTVKLLRKEGFTSLPLLRRLTPDLLIKSFQKRIPLAQYAALTAALEDLRQESSTVKQSERRESATSHEEEEDGHETLFQGLGKVVRNIKGETLTFLMVGNTGSGKSTTGNTILGGEFFQASAAFTPVTAVCELKRSTRNGVTIEIMDCPGLCNESEKDESVATIVVRAVGGMHPGPHAILFFVRIGRFTEEEEHSYTLLMALFEERLAKYTIVVFTGGDKIRSSDSFEEMIAANIKLQSILRACDYRYVIFNNMTSDKEPQVDILLQKVRELVAKNGGEPYTCPKYFKIAEAIEEEVKKRMSKVEIEIFKKKNYVQELDTKPKQVREELDRERTEIQEREKTQKQNAQEKEKLREQVESLNQQLEHMNTTEAWQRSYYFDSSSSQTMRFILMGKTGGDKSTTGNTILGETLFEADLRFSSVTSNCYFHARKRHGITIEIIDSPGLWDTKIPEEDTAIKVVQAVACMHPGPTAFLYVIGIGRYTDEDEGVYKRFKSLFDDRVTGYTIIIFTRGDLLKKHNKTIEDVLSTAPDGLRKMLRECGNRYVVFDNTADDKQPQVDCLLELVREMSSANQWKPYTCPRYEYERMNQEVARRLRKVQEEEMKRKKYVQELMEKVKLAEQKAEQ
ncbi:hypothetical protein C0Q70_06453 [Pomacea canaliculata]|uniref:AIG1-type G domain-containing protein n=1 Tax=Pomacea canaliculata TaxID=400727 RepID=A0A2T7PP26_POMCA|nr:uncharacterized protein LOC112558747 [Pomacea canaliculata]XP_025085172.1 uncharacterized protein LOC112558747 [Pomacea canaliculata]XP_025085173.1 uncharacterized protein LOC112558747 [Pomacea canaliculata]XP_025085174.1 uncharacterized protein LOC112558747 [Pomacea canaliculata]PVD35172.1 hypothetical protein C0Q70_06453 [Pomacea canaliculata]